MGTLTFADAAPYLVQQHPRRRAAASLDSLHPVLCCSCCLQAVPVPWTAASVSGLSGSAPLPACYARARAAASRPTGWYQKFYLCLIRMN